MYRSFVFHSMIAAAMAASAQTTLHQVLVLNEGRYDYLNQVQAIPVTLGSYDPVSGIYTEQVTIADARFGNDVKVENEVVYVSADSFLLKYDANSFALLDMAIVRGIRRIALWNDQLLVTRGEFGGLGHYFEVRDKNNFDLLYELTPADGLLYSSEAVVVIGDKAYLSVNNGFDWPDYTNLIGVVDLNAQVYDTEIDLGPDGYNPEHLMVSSGSLYAFNNKDYTGSSISKIDPASGTLEYTNNVAFNSGCGTSAAVDDKIYFMEYIVNQLARYDLATEQVLDTLANGLSAYGVLGDPINNVMYVTTTDFVSSGTFYVTELNGMVLSSVAVGVSPGKMDLDLRMSTLVPEAQGTNVVLIPNPAIDMIVVQGVVAGTRYELIDASGRVAVDRALLNDHRVDVAVLPVGVYTIRFSTAHRSISLPLMKQ